MIEYSVLCQAIDEWKAGQRPSSGPHAAASASGESYEVVEEMNSGIVMLDDPVETVEGPPPEHGDAETVEGDGQVEGEHGYQGETAYAAAGDPVYSGDTDHAHESDPPEGDEAAEEQDQPDAPENDELDDEEIPIDTTPETKPSGE
jgi:hypothetical protein